MSNRTLATIIAITLASTAATAQRQAPVEDLNRGIDPNKGCSEEDQYRRNGICYQRVILEPEYVSREQRYVCPKADGTVELRINKYELVDVIHVTQGKKLKHPRMSVIVGEDELEWETTRDDGLEIHGSLSGEGLNSYTERLSRDGKLIAETTTKRCKTLLVSPALADTKVGCFSRTYDRTHLARHPDQIVTATRLNIYPAPRSSSYPYGFGLRFRMRGRETTLRTEGNCVKEASGLKCQVECDGGSVRVEHRTGHVMMYLDRVRMAACGVDVIDGGQEISGGKDDRVFRLDRVADAVCRRRGEP
jgi:hypothetical protein